MSIRADLTARVRYQPRESLHVLAPPRLVVSDGTIEALKWLALVLMTLDHVNKYLFAESLYGLNDLGRLAMPLFGFVLAHNLTRPGALQRGLYVRVMARLALFGVLATPFYTALGGLAGSWWPLNILFTLLAATAVMYFTERGRPVHTVVATIIFLIGGAVVDYWWFGLTFCLAAWWYCRAPSGLTLTTWIAASALLCLLNDSLWTLAALPIIFASPLVRLNVPRLRFVFYAYYPTHLALLLSLS